MMEKAKIEAIKEIGIIIGVAIPIVIGYWILFFLITDNLGVWFGIGFIISTLAILIYLSYHLTVNEIREQR